MQVIIIGGGAAGMMAALTAAKQGASVTLLEKNERLGKKLAATGNGRGNLSNRLMNSGCYNGADPGFTKPALAAFGVDDTVAFFRALGVICREDEDGKLYPMSNQASSVVDCLRFAIEAAGINVLTGFTAEKVRRDKHGFTVTGGGQELSCDRLIIAAGGEAAPKLGGSPSGYKLLEALGHHSTPRFPALVQVKTDNTYPKAMQGLKIDGEVTLEVKGGSREKAAGEILFTEYGISGPAVFAVSRVAAEAAAKGIEARAVLDMLPELGWHQLYELLAERSRSCGYLTLENFFAGLLHKKLGIMLCKYCGIAPLSRLCGTLTDNELKQLADAVKKFRLAVKGVTGFANAQVTAGGISTKEVDPRTMGSRLVSGLYLAGEVLDIDGICGGYNLQWAWSSGYLAGCLL